MAPVGVAVPEEAPWDCNAMLNVFASAMFARRSGPSFDVGEGERGFSECLEYDNALFSGPVDALGDVSESLFRLSAILLARVVVEANGEKPGGNGEKPGDSDFSPDWIVAPGKSSSNVTERERLLSSWCDSYGL